ncbi:MAG TPA: isocitrate lyase/PEP mutase family protein [Burkholderiaceae bacterium]|nr:isocitrate lyase/PEP mutase family protein [Burkholderiaceae bacterium]
MRLTTRLLELIKRPEILVMPAVYDAMSARLVQEAGFPAVQCSGLSVSAAQGVPDMSILSMREMVEFTRSIVSSVNLPVMGDADNGYGNAINVWYTMREFEAAGAAGANLEDQIFPKRCGRLAGKELVSQHEMMLKIESARDALRDDDFVINARTDALTIEGIDAAIARGNAYLKAGASMIFVQGVSTKEQIETLTSEIHGPVGINLVENDPRCEELTFSELQRLGVARVSLSASVMLAAMHGIRQALQQIIRWDGTRCDDEVFAPFDDLHRLAGLENAKRVEREYVNRVGDDV